MRDTIVDLPDIPVMYVAGEAGSPIAEQAPKAMRALEAQLGSLKHRRFYGVGVGTAAGDEYRACVALDAGNDLATSSLARWTIPGGRYARRRIADWEQKIALIAPTFADLRARHEVDPTRPWIEFYRSQRVLLVMVPVR
jgi:DNA gyrase inhibitor GyrI